MKKWILLASAALLSATGAQAKDKDKDKESGEEEKKDIAAFVSDFTKTEGLFPLYRDPETGEIYMEIDASQLGDEFIYFTYTENGPVEAGHFRGNFRDNRIVSFNRRFDRVEVEAINTSYYFDPDNAISRAATANVARAPLANLPIAAESKDGRRVLISADELLENESLHQVRPWQDPDSKPGQSFALGELSKDKTRIAEAINFPENTDFRVEYVFDNPKPVNYGNPDITDARSVAILVQHSFLEMPEAGFEPRFDDYRVGYFTSQVDDLTSDSFTPYRDVINRWRLQKKDPGAQISDPVKPITFWIENTTPLELRGMIRDAALTWNTAFEAAGFSNAIRVEIQPDDARWDAGDVRYNVLRWTSSPNPPFGGYGPSFTNPRTGEILGADIMLEYSFITRGVRLTDIFGSQSASSGHDHQGRDCDLGDRLKADLMTARILASAQGVAEVQNDPLVRQYLYYLIIHEIGHTLGLNHNMRSTSTVDLDALDTPGVLPTNSVMDYPAVNLARPGETQGQYAIDRPGPYDIWAIQFGYTPENAAIDGILARSTEPQLAFGNDADDLRAPGRHIDPRVMINDLSDDPITWAGQHAALMDQAMLDLPDRVLEPGDSYQSLVTSYALLSQQKYRAAEVASRWIGGVFNNRSNVGQSGAQQPFVPVPAAEQRRALATVYRIALAPDAFAAGENLLNRLQIQRRGFNAFGERIDPQPHDRALTMQRGLLNHLLHPNVLSRLTDARRYGGTYSVASYMDELTGMVFDADKAGAVNTYRQNLQIEYVTRLLAVAGGKGGGMQQTPVGPQAQPNFDYVARSAALASIREIKAIASGGSANAETRAHRGHILSLIEEFERR
ncbi:zinc-dependent metalloprotease [Qipengyuania sphaerica]|uniref:zinc-dependent metalloprotease n=1 Tax=Qipengyuania sphaerica TaxID=2867243 RepID=UPI001C86BA13|nr:zinc-dependent metalloprotease [Qipengyuania sphaerica]MBX7541583.1 zinc-dependent metalloprotease [Qipengyuania sphaerica]